MARNAPKLEGNPFYDARKAMADENKIFDSRERASEMVLIEQTRLGRIETGDTIPYPDEVCSMADVYDAPELKNVYCSKYCPIGNGRVKIHDIESFDRVAVKVLGSLREAQKLSENIISVAESGDIDVWEYPQLKEILISMDKIIENAQAFKLWVEKNKHITDPSQID